MMAFRKILPSQSGQALTEMALILPLLLVLALGAIEISNIIYTYLVLTHLTREGGNMISRGTPANVGDENYGDASSIDYDALDAIVDSSAPVITPGNESRWKIFYSMIAPSNPTGCLSDPVATNPACAYVVEPQISRGSLIGVMSAIGLSGGAPNLPNLSSVAPGRTFYAVEVFYQYTPITPLANFGVAIAGVPFYERAVF
jgi:Flp pilus assembly protein TadG